MVLKVCMASLAFFAASCSVSPLQKAYSPPEGGGVPSGNGGGVSVFRYGRSLLKGDERAAYDEIIRVYSQWEENGDAFGDISHRAYFDFGAKNIRITNTAQFLKILRMAGADSPELFRQRFATAPRGVSYSGGALNTFYMNVVGRGFTRRDYDKDLALIKAKGEELLTGLQDSMSDAQKVRFIHDRFLSLVRYSLSAPNVNNLRGALVDHAVLCQGYAFGFLYLLQQAGLKAFYTDGYLRSGSTSGEWGLHSWVGVQVDGAWYYVDITSNDGIGGSGYHHTYFLMGDKSEPFTTYHSFTQGQDQRPFPFPAMSPTNYPLSKTAY